MAIQKTVKLDKSSGVKLEPDMYIGLLAGIIHVGLQENTYNGVTSHVDRLVLQFELQDALTDEGKAIVISKTERNSMKEKANLIKTAKALGANVDEGVDFESLIGKPCLVKMERNTKGNVVPKGIEPLPKKDLKDVKPLQATPRVLLDVEEITEAQLSEMPQWIRDVIAKRIRSDGSSVTDGSDSVEL